ncbi:MAG: XRE family transcriptional regulator [Lachnospiraceae bacterium]|nr:XRE family transcriptional regulator [Lachnospiraceae bacterium]
MGKKSSIENKNIYLQCREDCDLTRAEASELMKIVSESRIEKIESEKIIAAPEDIVAMAEAYKQPRLCNYYCANECAIGKTSVPELQVQNLSEITLGIIASLNSLNYEKERLISIAVDGQISEEEMPDFIKIQKQLNELSLTVEALKLWINSTIASGKIDKKTYDKYLSDAAAKQKS